MNTSQIDSSENHGRGLRRWHIVVLILIAVAIALVVAVNYALHRAAPMLRSKIIQSLSTRFDSQVKLGELNIWITHGINVEGKNLSLSSNRYPTLPPQISVGQFSFHVGLMAIFQRPIHVRLVELHDMSIKIPPKGERAAMHKAKHAHHGKIDIIIDRIVCDDTLLVLLKEDPSKTALQFKIHALTLQRVGSGKPMHFDAQLVNPKPLGNIATHGSFGPWNADHPHDTPVDGIYSFTNADLSTTKGIAGTLSSKGKFSGPLDTLSVDGETDTPNFSVDVSGHPVALHTDFHAIVNGTNGNTYLQPVKAHFLNTDVTAKGSVVRGANGHGHDINLDVTIDQGRIEDLLEIGANTEPPVLKGAVQIHTKFDLPTGPQSVSRRLRLQGTFDVKNATFSNLHIQQKVDELSLRSRGKTDQAKEVSQEKPSSAVQLPNVPVNLKGTFAMANQKIRLPRLRFTVPGAQIALHGVYSLDGKQFDFSGHARLQAHLSSVVGGWKGKLLTPLDPFFAKNGHGTVIPIKITGTRSSPQFGLNF